MTLEETAKIMDILEIAYPQFYRSFTDRKKLEAAELWAAMFADDDALIVAAAVKAFIAADRRGFPPHIGAIKEKINLLTRPDEMTEEEAWSLVKKALRNSGYHSREEFEKLPEMLQRLVGSPSRLKEWALMNIDEVNTVVASNFQRSYRARAASEREYKALPNDIKTLIGSLADTARLPGGEFGMLGGGAD